MSRTTNEERLMRLETQQTAIITDIKEVKDLLKDYITKQEHFNETLDMRYSSKWVERVAIGLIGLILTAFIGALIALVGLK